MTANTEQESQDNSTRHGNWRRGVPWLLGLAVLSAIVLGPYWFSSWVAGFLIAAWLWILFSLCVFAGYVALFMVACARFAQDLRTHRKMRAVLWLSMALGVVLTYAQFKMGETRSPDPFFGRGMLARLEIRTDINAVRTWIASLDPNDCLPLPHDASPGRNLGEEELPEVLRRQSGMVSLELDAEGRPFVRLKWDQSKSGVFGLVIGHRDMQTPPSEPGMYGEKRTRLRPGVYFWYEES